MKFFQKVFIPVAIILVLVMLIYSYLAISASTSAAYDQSIETMNTNVKIILRSFAQSMEDMYGVADTLTKNEEILDLVNNYDINDVERVETVRDILIDVYSSFEHLNNANLTSPEGYTEIDAKSAFRDNPLDKRQSQPVVYFSENPHEKHAMSNPKIGEANNRPIISLYAQIRDQGQFRGLIVLPINLDLLIQKLVYPNVTSKDINVILTDETGLIFGSLDTRLINNEVFALSATNPDLFEEMKTNLSGVAEEKFIGMDALIRYEYLEDMKLFVIAYQDTAPFVAARNQEIITGILIALVILTAILITLYIVVGRIVNPLRRLATYANDVGAGNLDQEISGEILEREDEIGILGLAFSNMVTSLSKSFRKQEEYTRKIEYMAEHDPLTMLKNRRYFETVISGQLDNDKSGSVVMMDIDNFKMINDTSGHVYGDQVLIQSSRMLEELCNEEISVCRFGGDEFIVNIENDPDGQKTERFVRSVMDRFKEPLLIENRKTEVSFSIGIAMYNEAMSDMVQLVKYADMALYTVKQSGKKRYSYFREDMEELVIEKSNIQREVRNALANNGFEMVYQPQVNPVSEETMGYEALIRLKNRSYGPDKFIKTAEEMGEIIEIGRWVVMEVLSQMASWRQKGMDLKIVSINFSAEQLHDEDFVLYLENMMDKYDIPGELLELEVTESVFISQYSIAQSFIQRILKLGIRISIDDFGTGYSSLSYLISLPIYKVKLDRSLIDDFLERDDLEAIRSLITLAHSLDLSVIAEGVERGEQVRKLVEVACDAIQGYYFSKPLMPDAVYM